MGFEIEDGTVKVSVGYSLKRKVAAGSLDMHDSHMSVSFDIPIEQLGKDTTAALGVLETFEAQLAQHVKLGVFAQLGAEFDETADGVLIPKSVPKDAQGNRSNGQRRSSGSGSSGGGGQRRQGGGGSRQFAPPKADVSQQPTVTLNFGKGDEDFYDLRSLKEDGTYSPRAADFQKVGGTYKVWITDQQGNVKQDVAAALDQAGVSY